MRRIHIYQIDDLIFFVPTLSMGEIYSKMIQPILQEFVTASTYTLGRTFIETFENSHENPIPSAGSGVFKELLELTKSSSHKKFVATALCIIATENKGTYSLTRVGGNEKLKSFVEDLGIEAIHIDINNAAEDEIGEAIQNLFAAEEEDHLKPPV